MTDLRIIIVAWNNRETLSRCLASVPSACGSLDWSVVVIDNASTDGTRDLTVSDNARIRYILNKENRGFAKACNQGIAGSDARYVLLLNPDTECPDGSLEAFVKEADKHPKAGILGPKLLNEDGSVQTSLRRYPEWSDQMGILFKLHNFFPNVSIFRRYFAKDRDLNLEASVEQVMGACFLIRREVIESIGGLDERYFAWFEEVDYCLTAKNAGWEIRYLPKIEVRHAGGHSFSQVFSVKKQRIFNRSLVSYFRKWHSGWRAETLAAVSGISIVLAWLAGKIGLAGRGSRDVLKRGPSGKGKGLGLGGWLLGLAMIELVSGLTIFHNAWNSVAVIAASFAMAIVAWKKPELGLAAILLELVVGSKGALLQLGGWPGTSLRICLFASFFIGWAGSFFQSGSFASLVAVFRKRWEWIGLVVVLAYATIRGLALHQPFFLQDANAWIFLALIVPVFDVASRKGSKLFRYAASALVAGIVWMGFKTLALEYFFSHGFQISPSVYLWVRRTGVGEVTLVTVNAFRLFFQSHIYAMVGLIGSFAYLIGGKGKGDRVWGIGSGVWEKGVGWIVLMASTVALLISLSRSIWMGTAAGCLVLALCYRNELVKQWRTLLGIFGAGVASLALIFGALAFPIPHVDVASLKDVFGSRVSTGDPASASRWNLLQAVEVKIKEAPILGSGFGAAISYESKDPRVLKDHPDGMYTTYAFEWGWFEHWVKFGFFGFLFMAFFIFRIGWRAWKSDAEPWLRYAMIATLAGLSVVHIFTPYLNHPLGFGILMLIEGVSLRKLSSDY